MPLHDAVATIRRVALEIASPPVAESIRKHPDSWDTMTLVGILERTIQADGVEDKPWHTPELVTEAAEAIQSIRAADRLLRTS